MSCAKHVYSASLVEQRRKDDHHGTDRSYLLFSLLAFVSMVVPHLTLRRCPVSRVQTIPKKGLDDVLSYN